MEDKKQENNLSYAQLKAMKNRAKIASEEMFLERSRKRLDTIVSTKIRTAFIGALAAFEDEFGFLWGHNVSSETLTDEQESMRNLWENVRTAVLNNGNAQLRAVKNEIANHVIKWNRYRTDFIIRTEDKENEDEK